jgi:hypothetical protein
VDGSSGSSVEGGADGTNPFEEPVVLATNQAGPRAIAVDRGYVYWACPSTNKVWIQKRGATDVSSLEAAYPRDIVTDGATLFVSTDKGAAQTGSCGGLLAINAGGLGATREAGCIDTPLRLSLAGASLYAIMGYGDIGAFDTSSLSYARVFEKTSPAPTVLTVLAGVAYYVRAGTLFAQSLSQSPERTVTPSRVLDVVADGSHVYWVTDRGDVARIGSEPSAAPEPLASGVSAVVRIAADATNLYASATDGNITAVPKSGGPKRTIARGQGSAYAIAADDLGVYWTTLEGNVMMASKRVGPRAGPSR